MELSTTLPDAPEDTPPAGRPCRRTAIALGAVAALAFALAACGGDDDDDTAASDTSSTEADSGQAADDGYGDDSGGGGSTTSAAAGGDAVTYEVTSVDYSDATAPAGGTLEIENSSGAAHTFTSDDDAFEEVGYGADESATVQVPAEPGEYGFHCEIHPSMQATLTAE